jgi:hypothetical protein
MTIDFISMEEALQAQGPMPAVNLFWQTSFYTTNYFTEL